MHGIHFYQPVKQLLMQQYKYANACSSDITIANSHIKQTISNTLENQIKGKNFQFILN